MMRMPQLKGILAPMVTPMVEDGSMDVHSIKNLSEHMVENSALSGLFMLGATGEYSCFGMEERLTYMSSLKGLDHGNKTLIINVGGLSPELSPKLAATALDYGFDAVSAVVVDETGNNPQKIYDYFAPLAEVGIPFVLYWPPMLKASKPSVSIVEKLLKFKTFVGLKDSKRDMEVFAQLCAIFGNEISVIQGVEMLYLPSLALGCAGVIGGGANIYPGKILAIQEAFNRGDTSKAIDLQQHLTKSYQRMATTGSVRYIIKILLKNRGIITNATTLIGSTQLLDEASMDWATSVFEI